MWRFPWAQWSGTEGERDLRAVFDDIYRCVTNLRCRCCQPPPRYEFSFGHAVGKIVDNDEKFKVEVDVRPFKADELRVVVGEDALLVKGLREECTPAGSVTRRLLRRYDLPAGTAVEHVSSRLSDNGILSVVAPKTTTILEW